MSRKITGRHSRDITGATPGSEAASFTRQVGEGVTKFKPEQRAVHFFVETSKSGNGSWQQYVSLSEDFLWPVPGTIPHETAAQFVINPWTVYRMLSDLDLTKGEYILQTAAGSVLGTQVIQLAKHWGIKTMNVARRAEQKEELFALGTGEVICSTEEDIVARVKQIAGKKLAWGALDPVAGAVSKEVCASVRGGGQVFVYGAMSGIDVTIAIPDLFRGIRLSGWSISDLTPDEAKRKHFTKTAPSLWKVKLFNNLLVGRSMTWLTSGLRSRNRRKLLEVARYFS